MSSFTTLVLAAAISVLICFVQDLLQKENDEEEGT